MNGAALLKDMLWDSCKWVLRISLVVTFMAIKYIHIHSLGA